MKKLISLLLTLCLLSVLYVPAIAAEKESDQTFHYVTLGASNTNGYALHGYLTEDFYANPVLKPEDGTPGISGYRTVVPYSYPALVADYYRDKGYTVDHAQLAQSAMRVEELRFLLDESFTTDEYMRWRFYAEDKPSTWWYSSLDELRKDYKQSIADADLITYDMGLNNFGVYLTNRLLSGDYGNDLSYVIGSEYASRFYKIRAELEKGVTSLSLGLVKQDDLDTLDNLLDTIAYALLGYCVNFDATMKIIRELNPDATIVVLNVQNIMDSLDVSYKGIPIPLGDIMGIAVNMANSYTSLASPYKNEYLYADAIQNGRVTCFMDQLADYNGDPSTITQDMKDCYNVYDTSLPLYLKFRVAARICVAKGYCPATWTINETEFKKHLPEFVSLCEKNCPDFYDQVMTAEYDAMTTLFQAGLSTNPVPVDDVLSSGDISKQEDALVSGIYDVMNQVTDTYLAGGTYTEEQCQTAIQKLLATDDMKAVAAIGVRASIGNTFFSHPNRQGCQELYEAVVYAIEHGSTGTQVALKEAPNVLVKKPVNTLLRSLKNLIG